MRSHPGRLIKPSPTQYEISNPIAATGAGSYRKSGSALIKNAAVAFRFPATPHPANTSRMKPYFAHSLILSLHCRHVGVKMLVTFLQQRRPHNLHDDYSTQITNSKPYFKQHCFSQKKSRQLHKNRV